MLFRENQHDASLVCQCERWNTWLQFDSFLRIAGSATWEQLDTLVERY